MMMNHLTLIQRFTTRSKAEASIPTYETVLATKAHLVFIGPGRYPWGIAVDADAADEAFAGRYQK